MFINLEIIICSIQYLSTDNFNCVFYVSLYPSSVQFHSVFSFIYNLGEFEAEFSLDKWPPCAKKDDVDGVDDEEGGLRFCFNWFFRRGRESCWPGKREGWCCWKTSCCSFCGITVFGDDAVWWCFCIIHVHDVFYKSKSLLQSFIKLLNYHYYELNNLIPW